MLCHVNAVSEPSESVVNDSGILTTPPPPPRQLTIVTDEVEINQVTCEGKNYHFTTNIFLNE